MSALTLSLLLIWCFTHINVLYSDIRCGHDDVEYDITRNENIEPEAIPYTKLFNPLASLSSATGATKWLLNKIDDTHKSPLSKASETHSKQTQQTNNANSDIANQNDIIQTFSSRKNTKPHRHHTSPHAFEHNIHHRHSPNADILKDLDSVIDTQSKIDSSVWKPFRIHYNSDSIVSEWHNKAEAHHFATNVIPAAIHYLERSLYVRPVQGKLKISRPCVKYIINSETNEKKCVQLKWNWEQCGSHVTIPTQDFEDTEVCQLDESEDSVNGYQNCKTLRGGEGYDSDIILYFSGDGDFGCSDVYGYSAYCHSNKYDRPIAGFVNLCEDTLVQENRIFTWEQKVTLIVHEVFHVLGFSSTGFAYFRYNDAERTPRTPRDKAEGHPLKKSSGDYRYGSNTIQYHQIRDKFATFIVLPTVVKYAKKFFECSDVIGIELEDFGGHDTAASHWEQRILGYEFMIGYIPPAAPFSVFSFAVLEDSGWYRVNWKYAALHPYGREFGCDWIDQKCLSASSDDKFAKDMLDPLTFCTSDIDYGCSKDHIAISNCQIEEYKFELPEYFQYFGAEENANLGGRLEYADYCPMYYHYNNGDCRFVDASIKHKRFGATITPQSKCVIISHPNFHYLNLKMQGLDGEAIVPTNLNEKRAVSAAHDEIEEERGGMGGMHRHRRKKPLPKELGVCYKMECFTDSEYAWTGLRIEVWNMEYEQSEWLTCWGGSDDGKYKITALHEYDIRCPLFSDICYDNNPWLCNGHGMLDRHTSECVCNAGYIGCDCLYDDTHENREKYPYSDNRKCQEFNIVGQHIFAKPPIGNQHTRSQPLDILHDLIWNEIDVHFGKYEMVLVNVAMDLKSDDKYVKIADKSEELNLDFVQCAKTIKLLIAIPLKIDVSKVWIEKYKIVENEKSAGLYNIEVKLAFENEQKMSNKQLSYQMNKILHKLFDSKVKMEIVLNGKKENQSQDEEIENNAQMDYSDQDDEDTSLGINIGMGTHLEQNSGGAVLLGLHSFIVLFVLLLLLYN